MQKKPPCPANFYKTYFMWTLEEAAQFKNSIFCRFSMPQATTRWARSTFSSRCPHSSKHPPIYLPQQHQQFFPLNFLGVMLGIKPRAAGCGSKYANQCAMLPSPPQSSSLLPCTALAHILIRSGDARLVSPTCLVATLSDHFKTRA